MTLATTLIKSRTEIYLKGVQIMSVKCAECYADLCYEAGESYEYKGELVCWSCLPEAERERLIKENDKEKP